MSSSAPPVSVSLRTRWSRDLLFHAAGLLTSNVGLVLWVTGVSVSLSLAITFFGLIVALAIYLVVIWLLAGAGAFWPFFPALGLAIVWAVHALIVYRDRLPLGAREQELVERVDDGPGGADPAGGGLSGLRARVEALDGTLTVMSPPGGGTTIRAELPCGP